MKHLLTICICAILLVSMVFPASATEQPPEEYGVERVLGNGLTVIDEITIYSQARSTDKRVERKGTIKDGDTVIGVIAFESVFRYDGSTVSVVSKTVTQTDTYAGWSYKQKSFTTSGGTVTLDAKLTKLLIFNIAFTFTLSCDKNGNISYT